MINCKEKISELKEELQKTVKSLNEQYQIMDKDEIMGKAQHISNLSYAIEFFESCERNPEWTIEEMHKHLKIMTDVNITKADRFCKLEHLSNVNDCSRNISNIVYLIKLLEENWILLGKSI